MKVLQLVQDTPFINDFFRITCAIDKAENHDFLVYHTPSGDLTKLINLDERVQARIRFRGTENFKEVLDHIKEYDKIFIHYLTYEMHELLERIPGNIKVFWFFFGSDYYCPDWKFATCLYDNLSLKFAVKRQTQLDEINSEITYNPYNPIFLIPHYKKKAAFWKEVMDREKRKYMDVKYNMTKRINYIAGYNPLEFDFIKQHYPTTATYLPSFYTYFTSENTFFPPASEKGDNMEKIIHFGNCGTPSNNHEELLEVLKNKVHGKKIKVKMPLSYGDKAYIEQIKKKFKNKLNGSFESMESYIPKEQYYTMLAGTDIAIMNHKVNEAGTNIFMLLFYGKKVFTRKTNVFYQFLTGQGIKMFTIEDFENWPIERSLEPLSDEDIEHNRKTMYEIFSKEKLQGYLKTILSI